ncbi:MAG: TerB N-terminal domain-containing protein [Defluviitaleaceae bacterium]|nr:TerB N-terminal domain-containing protein [Defluviitaleaceae bacterium]MCL2275043.1 TerB N-terminal domain-containing protein [Defluviitaleaceae bacterium]
MKTDSNYARSHSFVIPQGETPPFAEIDMGDAALHIDGNAPTRDVPVPQAIPARAYDPLRARFRDMRKIADYAPYSYQNDGWLFYEQARFMADITDDYTGRTAFSAFYPYYQRMGYEQLRTYFTWRTQVRMGTFPFVGASYLFLYIYELLSCIGVQNANDALLRLAALLPHYREAVPALTQYMPRWVKDFHIYYNGEVATSFGDFVAAQKWELYYTDNTVGELSWKQRSGYDIAKSKFYTGNEELINESIDAVFAALNAWCGAKGIELPRLLLHDERPRVDFWKPFTQALFYPWQKQPNRRVVMPNGEHYVCENNRWTVEKNAPFAGMRELVGYIIKKTESELRTVMKHKQKLVADPQTLKYGVVRLKNFGLTFAEMDSIITQAVAAHIREINKIEVTVNTASLVKIREEAQDTQEKLTVEEETGALPEKAVPPAPLVVPVLPTAPTGGWAGFAAALSDIERAALRVLLNNEGDLLSFANAHDIMLEVLAEGINEKAFDFIGDNILDTDADFEIYADYTDDVKGALPWRP